MLESESGVESDGFCIVRVGQNQCFCEVPVTLQFWKKSTVGFAGQSSATLLGQDQADARFAGPQCRIVVERADETDGV